MLYFSFSCFFIGIAIVVFALSLSSLHPALSLPLHMPVGLSPPLTICCYCSPAVRLHTTSFLATSLHFRLSSELNSSVYPSNSSSISSSSTSIFTGGILSLSSVFATTFQCYFVFLFIYQTLKPFFYHLHLVCCVSVSSSFFSLSPTFSLFGLTFSPF